MSSEKRLAVIKVSGFFIAGMLSQGGEGYFIKNPLRDVKVLDAHWDEGSNLVEVKISSPGLPEIPEGSCPPDYTPTFERREK